jgi:hypothetical protein
MFAKLLHWWRLLTSEDQGLHGVWRYKWRVRYPDGVSEPMPYKTACSYATLFGGKVERVPEKGKEVRGCNRGNRCPWGEESAPEWRSTCKACGRKAQGSGQ